MQIDYDTTDEVRQAIARLGRTEDLAFSPDGRRLAIAGFARNRILVIDVELPADGSGCGRAPHRCRGNPLAGAG